MPAINPPADLRDRVLRAVAFAIEQDTAHLEPLATIGRTRAGLEPALAGHIGNVGQFWRAAAFALCAGLIVAAYFLVQISSQSYQIAQIALTNNTDAQLEKLIGPTVKDFLFSPKATTVSFASQAAGMNPTPRAMMFIDAEAGQAFVVIENLPQSSTDLPYTLAMKDAAGNVEIVREFDSNGKLFGMHVTLKNVTARLRNASWEVRGPTGVLLASI
jgi:hypothetical protein